MWTFEYIVDPIFAIIRSRNGDSRKLRCSLPFNHLVLYACDRKYDRVPLKSLSHVSRELDSNEALAGKTRFPGNSTSRTFLYIESRREGSCPAHAGLNEPDF